MSYMTLDEKRSLLEEHGFIEFPEFGDNYGYMKKECGEYRLVYICSSQRLSIFIRNGPAIHIHDMDLNLFLMIQNSFLDFVEIYGYIYPFQPEFSFYKKCLCSRTNKVFYRYLSSTAILIISEYGLLCFSREPSFRYEDETKYASEIFASSYSTSF